MREVNKCNQINKRAKLTNATSYRVGELIKDKHPIDHHANKKSFSRKSRLMNDVTCTLDYREYVSLIDN